MPSRAIVLAVANQKGGVAKTTTVASLGAAWVELGYRVLMVDLDPQACSVRFAEVPAVGRTLVTSARAGKGATAYRTVAAALASQLRPA